MSEEEIRKALEIIKQPITVHREEYKYFDQENYDNLISVYNNCLWFVRNFEQIRETAIQIKEENTQLKSVLKEIREYVDNKLTDYNLRYGITNEFRCEWDDLLEIIDKAEIGEDNG